MSLMSSNLTTRKSSSVGVMADFNRIIDDALKKVVTVREIVQYVVQFV